MYLSLALPFLLINFTVHRERLVQHNFLAISPSSVRLSLNASHSFLLFNGGARENNNNVTQYQWDWQKIGLTWRHVISLCKGNKASLGTVWLEKWLGPIFMFVIAEQKTCKSIFPIVSCKNFFAFFKFLEFLPPPFILTAPMSLWRFTLGESLFINCKPPPWHLVLVR